MRYVCPKAAESKILGSVNFWCPSALCNSRHLTGLLISQHLFLCLYSGLLNSRADDPSEMVLIVTHRKTCTPYHTILSRSCHFSNDNEMMWKFSMARKFLWIWQGILLLLLFFFFAFVCQVLPQHRKYQILWKYVMHGVGGIGTVLSEKISHFFFYVYLLG